MDDDDFGEGSDSDMQNADMRRIADKLGKDGFRIGKAQEEEKQMQIGFDEGFARGIALGKACGRLLGACLSSTNTLNQTTVIEQLRTLLFETVPEEEVIEIETMERIEALVTSISLDLVSEFNQFHNAVVDLGALSK